jgi:hypothetical protein
MSLLAAAAILLAPGLVLAQVPQKVGYQGRLLGADGSPVTGPAEITFSVYDAASAGNVLWSEIQNLGLSDGYYATLLGSSAGLPVGLFDGSKRYLSIAVGGQQLVPRQEIGAVPYAIRAGSASVSVGSGLTGDGSAANPLATVKTPYLAQFDFDEGTGLSGADSSGNGAKLTINSVGTAWQDGHVVGTGSLFFDGLTGYAQAADSPALNPRSELTLSAWVYLTNNTGSRSIVCKENQYEMGINGGQVQLAVQTVKGPVWSWIGAGTIPLNTWTQVMATYDGVWIRTYVNGQLQSATSYPNGLIAATTNPLRVGGRALGGGSDFFAGRIDDLRIAGTAMGQAHNRVPQFIVTRDPRPTGCPPVQAANTDLISQTFSTRDVASIRVFANIIACARGRNDLILYFDGKEVDRTLSSQTGATPTNGGDCWVGMQVEATLSGVAPGNHTASIQGTVADTYGCQSGWGHISTMIFEQ